MTILFLGQIKYILLIFAGKDIRITQKNMYQTYTCEHQMISLKVK